MCPSTEFSSQVYRPSSSQSSQGGQAQSRLPNALKVHHLLMWLNSAKIWNERHILHLYCLFVYIIFTEDIWGPCIRRTKWDCWMSKTEGEREEFNLLLNTFLNTVSPTPYSRFLSLQFWLLRTNCNQEIAEISNLHFLNCGLLRVAWWNLPPSVSVPPGA